VSETRGIFCSPTRDFQSWKELPELGLADSRLPGDLLFNCTALYFGKHLYTHLFNPLSCV
jgi:hypothetical protein